LLKLVTKPQSQLPHPRRNPEGRPYKSGGDGKKNRGENGSLRHETISEQTSGEGATHFFVVEVCLHGLWLWHQYARAARREASRLTVAR
jgi:hypothetical protein